MPRATWKGAILAESDQTIVVEGNHYFPPHALHREHLRSSAHHTHCGWKGEASYFDVVVGDQTNANAAWYYPEPLEAARQIAGYVAFWHGVQIET